jgi:hypothetical protein
MTQEQIEKSISAAYDSVNLINALNQQGTLSAEDQACLDRNVEHIHIMLTKDWFYDALTPEQKTELEAI